MSQVSISQVDASATLELLMERFDNPTAYDAGGTHCDSYISRCDYIFRFALDRGNRCELPSSSQRILFRSGEDKAFHFTDDLCSVRSKLLQFD